MTTDHSTCGTLNNETKLKVSKLEKKVKQQADEIEALNTKVKYIEEKSEIMEKQLKGMLEHFKTTSEAIVKEATETVVKIISKQQDESEKRSEALFDSLNQQLSMISKYLITPSPSQQPSLPQQDHRQPQANYQTTPTATEQYSAFSSSRNSAKSSCKKKQFNKV